jgi:hypothetical protein
MSVGGTETEIESKTEKTGNGNQLTIIKSFSHNGIWRSKDKIILEEV